MINLFEVKKNKKDTITDFISNRFREHRVHMQDTHRTWMLNLAWVRGFQNVDYNKINKRYETFNQKNPWKVRLISNIMLPIVRRLVAQNSRINPIWEVLAATADEADIQIADKSNKVLQDVWVRQGMAKKIIRLLHWQSTCCSAFLKVGWDNELGDDVTIQKNDIEEDTANELLEFLGIETLPDEVIVPSGDLFIDVVSPFNITVDDSIAVFEDCDWLIESTLKSRDFIVDKFGTKYKNLPESSEQELFLYPFIHNRTEHGAATPRRGVLMHELFVRKTRKHKEGLHAIVIGNELISSPRNNPFDHMELPYAHFLEIYDPASFWGTCTAEQIRPNQARYNRISSGMMEQFNQMANLQWLNPKQSGIKQFNNRPGAVYNYNHPYVPTQTTPKPMPAYVERLLDRTRSDIQDTASTHDVSEAKNEPGVRSGRAVLALQEADDSILTPTLRWFDDSLARIGRLSLQTIIQNVDQERFIEVSGEFVETEIISFTGETLLGKAKAGNYWKVRVKSFGRQVMSRAAREQMAATLIETGLLDPQVNRDELLHMLGATDILSTIDKHAMDRVRQWKEIQQMIGDSPEENQQENQEIVQVYPGQNHLVHIEMLKKFISSRHWDDIDEDKRTLVINHYNDHMKKQVEEAIFPQAYVQTLIGDKNVSAEQKTS